MELKSISGYEGIYFVSDSGFVYRNGKQLKGNKSNSGYVGVSLCVNGQPKRREVHRIVAETFIPNAHNKREVNHINGIKTDNRVSNLEWVTSSENKRHAIDVLGKKPSMTYLGKFGKYHNRSVAFCLMDPGGKKFVFHSGLEAKREMGFDHTSISYARKNFQLPHKFKRGKLKGWTLLDD